MIHSLSLSLSHSLSLFLSLSLSFMPQPLTPVLFFWLCFPSSFRLCSRWIRESERRGCALRHLHGGWVVSHQCSCGQLQRQPACDCNFGLPQQQRLLYRACRSSHHRSAPVFPSILLLQTSYLPHCHHQVSLFLISVSLSLNANLLLFSSSGPWRMLRKRSTTPSRRLSH